MLVTEIFLGQLTFKGIKRLTNITTASFKQKDYKAAGAPSPTAKPWIYYTTIFNDNRHYLVRNFNTFVTSSNVFD